MMLQGHQRVTSKKCGGKGEAEENDTEGESEKLRQKTSVKST